MKVYQYTVAAPGPAHSTGVIDVCLGRQIWGGAALVALGGEKTFLTVGAHPNFQLKSRLGQQIV